MQTKALPGFREFYPADLALRTHIFRTWRTVATRYGFEEYDGPPLEPLELYTAKSGDEIVGQLYDFTDKGGREVALRPEMTPDAGPHGGGARQRAQEADPLVLHPPALPLRAAATGAASRALPAQLRPDRRAGPARRRRDHRARGGRDARLRARAGATCACGSPTGGCFARLLLGAGVAESAARRGVSGASTRSSGSSARR